MSLIGELSKCKMFKMQKLKCPSFKISTQNLLLSVSYFLQHTIKCHILLFRNCKLFVTLSGARAKFVPSYGAFPADDQQHQKRVRWLLMMQQCRGFGQPARTCSTVRLSHHKSIMSTPLLTFILT